MNYAYGNAAHLPYTAGQLSAYAFADKDVAENFVLEEIFFLRESVDGIMAKIENPSVAAFSSYIWNSNFNKEVARRIKEKYPYGVYVSVNKDKPVMSTVKYVKSKIGEKELTVAEHDDR